jgi:arsenate reductase
VKRAATTKPARKTTARKRAKSVQFLQKPACETCRKARNFMTRRGYKLHFRDLWKEPLSAADLEKLIGDRDHTEFLNPRSSSYRENEMGENPPSRREAIRMMARDPNLIRRPVVVAGGRVVLGFDKKGLVHF